jgi:integral membrane protein
VSPEALYRRVSVAEAITWALLLLGMVLKYVTDTTELGVQLAGPVHGVVFIAYCLVTVLLAVDRRWSPGVLLLGLVSAVPPFVTLWFEPWAQRRGLLGERWRLRAEPAASPRERPVAWLVRRPVAGAAVGAAAVAVLTTAALLAGPPV